MGIFVRVMAALLAIAIIVGIGTTVYNAGVSAGLAEAGRTVAESAENADTVLVPYGYGGGAYWNGPMGPGFIGPVFGVIVLAFVTFLVFGLLRAAFGVGRGGGPRGPGGPGSRGGGRRATFEAMHRDLHRGDVAGDERSGGA